MSSSSFPQLRRHGPSGRAVVTVRVSSGGRKDFYCGPFGSPESKAEHRRICAVLLDNGGVYPAGEKDTTVAECLLAYAEHAKTYYGPGGTFDSILRVLKTVDKHFGKFAVADFGPKALKTCQEKWVAAGITRKSVNKMTGTVKRAWRWMVAEEMIPADCFQRLQAVEGLRAGRTTAVDNPPVKPAVRADVEAAIAEMTPTVAAIVRLQILTGARCGELLVMKSADIDRTGDVWTFAPLAHKGTWRGKRRAIVFGPQAKLILAPFLLRAGEGFVFNPSQTWADHYDERSANRTTPRYPSHLRRNATRRNPNRDNAPGERYTTASVRQAVERACDRAGVPRFTPHRLRHLAAHIIRDEFGLDSTRAVLGHTVASMSEHYSRETDAKLAAAVALKIG